MPPQNKPNAIGLSRNRFLFLALLVLVLAAINAFGRLGSETVTEWDESLYATSAAEMLSSGNLVATTFNGQLDYYNSKPPLNVWLIALSFKLFGLNIVALRLPSALAALSTVALLMIFLRRAYGGALALMAGLALSTSFAFFYVHSGRTANPDALFTLLILATIVTIWAASQAPTAFLLIGVYIAAAVLLRGFGALLLVALAAIGAWISLRHMLTRRLIAGAGAIVAVLVGAWAVARWAVDGTKFFQAMFVQDALNRTIANLEGHPGSILFYLDVLQRYQYDWIAAGTICLLLRAPSRQQIKAWLAPRTWLPATQLLAICGVILLVVPTMMRTKATWYADPLLPLLAVIVGAAMVAALRATTGIRKTLIVAVIIAAAVVAESRLIWHSLNRRDLARADQGLLLQHKRELRGQRLYRARWTRADNFVVDHLIGAANLLSPNLEHFLADSAPGDFLLIRGAAEHAAIIEVGNNGHYFLYRRR